jgi:hypothetical protein
MRHERHERDHDRRRLFRKMEWVFVYLPPLLAVFIAAFGAAFLAWLAPVAGTTFWERWLLVVGIVLGVPLALYTLREYWQRRR